MRKIGEYSMQFGPKLMQKSEGNTTKKINDSTRPII